MGKKIEKLSRRGREGSIRTKGENKSRVKSLHYSREYLG